MNKAINPPFIKVFTLKFTYCLILLLLTLFSIKIYAQQHLVLKLESKPLNIEKKIISKFIAHSHKKIFHPDSIIISKDADTLFKYNFNRYFFTTQKKQDLNNYLNILTGTDSKNIPILIIDKNFNNNFSDDSIYRISISSAVSNEKEFYNLLPSIKVGSIEAINNDGVIVKKNITLKLAPYIEGAEFLNNKTEISNTKSYNLAFYETNYLSSNFTLDGQLYEIAVIPHPYSLPIYNFQNLAQDGKRWFLNIYKINPTGKDILIKGDIYQKIIDNRGGTDNQVQLGDKYVAINNVSLDSNLISITILTDSAVNKIPESPVYQFEKIETFTLYSLNKKTIVEHDFRKNKLTLLEFSGSWCVPCEEILPEVKNFYSKYSGKIDLITIMEEKNKNSAAQFFKTHQIAWNGFYENIDCTDCLKTRLKVKVFPAFFF